MNADVKFHQNHPALPHDDGNGRSTVYEVSSPHIVPTIKEQSQDAAMAEQYRSDVVSSYGTSRTISSDELFLFNTNKPPQMNAMLSSRPSTFDDRVETRGGFEVEVQVDEGSTSGEDSPNHDGEPNSAQNVHHVDGELNSAQNVHHVEGIFLKKFIPAREIHPDLHDNLNQLLDHRQSISTAMGLALYDDDMYHYQIYKDLFDQANCKMHTVLSKGMQVVNMRSSSDVNRGRGTYQDAVQNPVTPAFSPPASQSVNVQRWRGVDSLRLGDSTPRGHLKQSYKETDHAFEILCLIKEWCLHEW
jgi:hypothetical protein